MFKQYIKIAYRIFYRRKIYSLISLFGLVIAFSVSFLTLIYVINELQVNREFTNYDRLYRILNHQKSIGSIWAHTTKEVGPQFKMSISGIEQMTRIGRIGVKRIIFNETDFPVKSMFVDSDFFPMFSNERGINSSIGLSDPYSIVITDELAQRVFGNSPADGNVIKLELFGQEIEVTIKYTIEGFPDKSNIKADLIASMDLFLKYLDNPILELHPLYDTFILLSEDVNPSDIESNINYLDEEHFDGVESSEFRLQSFSDFYLDSNGLVNHMYATGDKSKINLFLAVGVIILIIATINFSILTTANSINRQKEFGVRKSFGSGKSEIRYQIFSESILLSLLAFLLAIIVTEISLPFANKFWDTSFDFLIIRDWPFFLIFIGIAIITGIFSGSYLSFYVVNLRPTIIFKASTSFKGSVFRKVLIIIQLFIFIALSAFSLILLKQTKYFLTKPLGYNSSNLIVIDLIQARNENIDYMNGARIQSFLDNVRMQTNIDHASYFTGPLPPYRDNTGSQGITTEENPNDYKTLQTMSGDYEIINTMGLEIIKGYGLRKGLSNEVLLTETAVKFLNLEDPIGKKITAGRGGSVVSGIVKDFHLQSFRRGIGPVLIRQYSYDELDWFTRLNFGLKYNVEIDSRDKEKILNKIGHFFPGYEVTYSYQEDRIKSLYLKERQMATTVIITLVLVLLIAGMGLFALSLYEAERRTKEIGIRKINGASTQDVLVLLSKDFTKWILWAFIFASPVSYFIMDHWLQSFVYKTVISWWIFVLAGIAAVLITWITISYQSLRVARKNPVEILRYE